MRSTHIILIAILQFGALGYGIMFTGAAARAGERFFEENPRLLDYPVGFQHALLFKNYGIWLSLIVLGWTLFAAYFSSNSNHYINAKYVVGSGLSIVILFIAAGAYFSVMATTPLWSF